MHNDALIVAGGANFPDGPPWTGGAKKWHDGIFVLTRTAEGEPADEWMIGGRLPKRIAYGASVSYPLGVLLIGGEEDGTPVRDVFRLAWDEKTKNVHVDTLPSLPKAASYLSGAMIGSTVYVQGAGRSEGADRLDEKFFWSLDIDQTEDAEEWKWTTNLPAYPGSPRHKSVVAAQSIGSGQVNLFLISGSNPRYQADGSPDLERFEHFTDAYRFDPIRETWSAVAELPIVRDPRRGIRSTKYAQSRWPVVAGVGLGLGQSHVMVFSGSTGRYVVLPVDERPEFPNTVLAYHTITDTWAVVDDMPQGVVTTGIAQWGDRYVIPSGEVKPGVRTNQVQSFKVLTATATFGGLNYTVLGVYTLGILIVGGFFATRTKTTNDFFRGGQRVPFWVAGLSIFATMLSSITFVALPAKAYATDWKYYLAQLTIVPIALIVVSLVIPFFRRLDATSAYEYLERRFSYSVRVFASLQFVLFQLARMAIVMYLPALALAAITPFSILQCVMLMGILSVVYCTLGGVEAVVWTDAIQTLVLLGGLLLAFGVVVANVEGGLLGGIDTAFQDGKLHLADLDFSWGSWATTTVWVVVVGQFFASLYSYTADQAVVQRYLTTRDERGARRAMWTTAWMGVFGSSLFFAMGSALYVFYKTHPTLLDVGMRNDSILPLFVANQLPAGVAGLVVAGIFAAAQSTISTSMNSTATAIVADFCMPFGTCRTDAGYLLLARVMTASIGLLGTLIACWLTVVGGSMAIDSFISVIGLFGGAVSGLFMLGMLTLRGNATGGLVGAFAGFATVSWVMFDESLAINRFLYAAIGAVTTFVVGYLVSALTGGSNQTQLYGLTVYDHQGTLRQQVRAIA
ncbi:sodium:solute symporter family transporter [Aeoliella sp.]|uniref:sodium:solute symporter family transporter n=1 Tax=Aeoliella sp. TaxID=2795800 RepID=UPI003CCBCFB0